MIKLMQKIREKASAVFDRGGSAYHDHKAGGELARLFDKMESKIKRLAEKDRQIAIRDRALYRACQGDGNTIQAFMDAGREDLEADEQEAQEESDGN